MDGALAQQDLVLPHRYGAYHQQWILIMHRAALFAEIAYPIVIGRNAPREPRAALRAKFLRSWRGKIRDRAGELLHVMHSNAYRVDADNDFNNRRPRNYE